MKNTFDKATEELNGLCDGSRKFTMSVPARNNDTDIVISNAIDLGRALAERLVLHGTVGEPAETRRIALVEAKELAMALLCPSYTAVELKHPLDFDPGQIKIGNTKLIKRA